MRKDILSNERKLVHLLHHSGELLLRPLCIFAGVRVGAPESFQTGNRGVRSGIRTFPAGVDGSERRVKENVGGNSL